jgi:transcription-repair coupling factor (superfamily II helicase)
VGFETYSRLLEEAVAELEGRELPGRREVELRLGLDLQLPERYIPEPALRLSFYKRLASVSDEASLDALLDEVVDRYGPAPPQLETLRSAQRLRMAAQQARAVGVTRRPRQWRIRLDSASAPTEALVAAVQGWSGARLSPEGEITLPTNGGGDLAAVTDFLVSLVRSR